MDSIIKTIGVTRAFPVSDKEEFFALKNVSIDIPKQKLTILRGRSGSGKTTLMNILGALDDPTEGQVYFDDKNITNLSSEKKSMLRRTQIGFVFQSVALIPIMTAYENVEFSLRLANFKGDMKKQALECLHLVGLEARTSHMPQQMSGGEQQRVAIARAIAHNPKVIFADEPTAELDTNTGLKVMKMFGELCEKKGITIIMTTHDTGLMELSDKVLELEDGEIVSG